MYGARALSRVQCAQCTTRRRRGLHFSLLNASSHVCAVAFFCASNIINVYALLRTSGHIHKNDKRSFNNILCLYIHMRPALYAAYINGNKDFVYNICDRVLYSFFSLFNVWIYRMYERRKIDSKKNRLFFCIKCVHTTCTYSLVHIVIIFIRLAQVNSFKFI